MIDRCAHQQQLAASKVWLTVADALPQELDGLGVFQRSTGRTVGIARVSTGLGCPHAETDPDFLGLMLAFRTVSGARVDFVAINDPTSPTDTPEEFRALLAATADAAGDDGLLATQTRLLSGLVQHAGLRAPAIAAHVLAQTLRTVHSKSAYQQYWTGVVRANDILGKFAFVPTSETPRPEPAGDTTRRLSEDWRLCQNDSTLGFDVMWIPYLSERQTPLDDLTRRWEQGHAVPVASVIFPQMDPGSLQARWTALLATELGANPGNWVETRSGPPSELAATRFTAARQLAYIASQKARGALPEASYVSFFERGDVSPELAAQLVARYDAKRAAGHWVPDLGPDPLT